MRGDNFWQVTVTNLRWTSTYMVQVMRRMMNLVLLTLEGCCHHAMDCKKWKQWIHFFNSWAEVWRIAWWWKRNYVFISCSDLAWCISSCCSLEKGWSQRINSGCRTVTAHWSPFSSLQSGECGFSPLVSQFSLHWSKEAEPLSCLKAVWRSDKCK